MGFASKQKNEIKIDEIPPTSLNKSNIP